MLKNKICQTLLKKNLSKDHSPIHLCPPRI